MPVPLHSGRYLRIQDLYRWALNRIFTSEEEALDVIEKAILLFKDRGLKGERFAETIERIGFENAEKQLLEKNLLERKMEILSK